jgi:DHA1 family bicyclomycin/chloramphenicol resistance-like MFS transporter
MKTIPEKHRKIATFLSFALIPISGFATDIYLPSFPAMAEHLHVSNGQIQLSLLLFLVSAGLSQLFVGSLLDSYGRFRISNAALFIFAIANFVIAWVPDIHVLHTMRVVQGISVAFIVVAKRAYFMDTFSGEKLKHYTSMFSIIWAIAPIVAPFLGGYLQETFGWQSNFYLLGTVSLLILALTLVYGGESIKSYKEFKARSIFRVYAAMIRTRDYSLALMIIGLSYGMLMVFGMTSPFIIEQVYHKSPVVTGYSALLSGVALMAGGIISKSTITRPLDGKIALALTLQLVIAIVLIATSSWYGSNIYSMMIFIALLHLLAGFIFNNLFAYSLGRFSGNAGVVSGLTGGGMYVITSTFSYGIVNILSIKSLPYLGLAYLVLVLLTMLTFGLFRKMRERAGVQEEAIAAAA